ncbi:MAG: GerMN domain-containing protein [Microcoleaceae cyanobacterium]
MKQPQPERKSPVAIVCGVCAVVLALTAGVAWWTLSTRQTQLLPNINQQTLSPTPSDPSQQTLSEQTVNVYWLQPDPTGQLQWVPTPVVLNTENNPSAILAAAFDRLLAQPESDEFYSEIPPQTQLLSLRAEGEDIYLDLSSDFAAGGGSFSMIGRLGQVIYTATSLDPQGNVWLSMDGKPLELLGGEGLEIAQPMTRDLFETEFVGEPQ